KVDLISLGDAKFHESTIEYLSNSHSTHPPVLGMDILEKSNFLIDFGTQKLYIKPLVSQP
ncbi:MAG TPA: hypothetical protein VFW40_06810, partial [Capsulimonadaceae bacterium]|nr:hypothetical protein [Capsulimonadaceae bacterium]